MLTLQAVSAGNGMRSVNCTPLTNVMRHARARQVRVRLSRDAAALCLTIQDDGQGMDTGRATRGLGLLGAVERAAAVGGELQVRSQPGAGVHMLLRVPLPPEQGLGQGGRMIRVLLADDHPVVRTGYRRLLEQGGDIRVVHEAGDGEAAYAARAPTHARRAGHRPVDARRRRARADPPRAAARAARRASSSSACTTARRWCGVRSTPARGGFLTKASAPDCLVEAVRRADAGPPLSRARPAARCCSATRSTKGSAWPA